MSDNSIPERLITREKNNQEIKNNLHANPYGGFSQNRPQISQSLTVALNGNLPFILLSGSPGSGKSSFLYDFLKKLLISGSNEIDTILWFSCTDEIDKISSTMNKVFSIEVSSKIKNSNPFSSLSSVLDSSKLSIIVFDSFDCETIADNLKNLIISINEYIPDKCKVIVTSRSNTLPIDENQFNNIQVPLFTLDEWINYIRSTNRIKISTWLESFTDSGNQIIRQVYNNLSGNIYAMEKVISLMAETGTREIDTALNNIPELYDYLIKQSWNTLSEKEKQLLFATALCCGTSNELDYSILKSILDKLNISEAMYDTLVLKCYNLYFLHGNLIEGERHYTLDFLLYKYLKNYFFNDCLKNSIFEIIIEDRIEFYNQKAKDIGFCYNNTEKMHFFDDPENKGLLDIILAYCYKYDYRSYIDITYNLRYFYYTRSIWTNDDENVHIKRARLSEKLGDSENEFNAYVYYLNIAAKYNDASIMTQAVKTRLKEIFDRNSGILPANAIFNYKHALSLYDNSQMKYQEAINRWEEILNKDFLDCNKIPYQDIDAANRWLLKCKINSLNFSAKEIIATCKKNLEDAAKNNFERGIVDYSLMIIDEYDKLAQNKKFISWKNKKQMNKYLDNIESLVKTTNDSLYIIHFYKYKAYASNNKTEIINYLKKALEKCHNTCLLVEKNKIIEKIDNTINLRQLKTELGV